MAEPLLANQPPPMNPEVFSAWQTQLFALMAFSSCFPAQEMKRYLNWLEQNADKIAPELAADLITSGRLDAIAGAIDAIDQLKTIRGNLMQGAPGRGEEKA